MKLLALISCSLSLLATIVAGDQGWDENDIYDDLNNNDGRAFAYASRPLWHIGQFAGNWPCYPDWPIDAAGNQNPGADLQDLPKLDGPGCPYPGNYTTEEPATAFPTYYTITRCSDSIGPYKYWFVNYHVYLPKVGYTTTGHRHDWVYASIYFAQYSDGLYHRQSGILSGGNGSGRNSTGIRYDNFYTFSGDDYEQNKFGLYLEHTKVFIGSEGHDLFPDKIDQCTEPGCHPLVTHRSDEWRYWAPEDDEHLVFANRGSVEGERVDGFDWGEAAWSPAKTQDGWCAEHFMLPG